MTTRHTFRTREFIRDKFREFANKHNLTYTEAMLEIIPEDPEPLEYGESVWLGVRSPAFDRLNEATGEGATYSDVLYYHLRRAQERERHET